MSTPDFKNQVQFGQTTITFNRFIGDASGPNTSPARISNTKLPRGAFVTLKTLAPQPSKDVPPTILIRKRKVGGAWVFDSFNTQGSTAQTPEQYCAGIKGFERPIGLIVIGSGGYLPADFSQIFPLLDANVSGGIDMCEASIHHGDGPLEEKLRSGKNAASGKPFILKVSPSHIASGPFSVLEFITIANKYVDGYAVTNTATVRLQDPQGLPVLSGDGTVWAGGELIRPISLAYVHMLSRLTDKPIIGIGGVSNVYHAMDMLAAGASLVGVCTAALLEPEAAYKLNQELYKTMRSVDANDALSFKRMLTNIKKEQITAKTGWTPAQILNFSEMQSYYNAICVVEAPPIKTEIMDGGPAIGTNACHGCTDCSVEALCPEYAATCEFSSADAIRPTLAIDQSKCEVCGLCISACKTGALYLIQPRQ